ncbi:hypothetical protein N072000002_09210 [Clostridium tetani]|uniref:Uncharacterized protein n=1 Tax=Clostridium tetani TaxID=1513 RepID=A0ABC8ECA3_CLOTA|nr:hypothetical protein [Clostridium tetani]BDR66693.1 hypothetical protein K144312032_09210 [Clostridium tetani]BDR80664.1 hypothetical protein K234311028_09100 [Clostridium tetani]BDR89120.1 hypothetical protein N072000002_09210 [Clostridium tetani]
MAKTYVKDGIEYTSSNHRMIYNPQFHTKHNKAWTLKDIAYLCGMWESTKKRDIALALGRTEGTCMSKVYGLKKRGEFNRYKRMFKEA